MSGTPSPFVLLYELFIRFWKEHLSFPRNQPREVWMISLPFFLPHSFLTIQQKLTTWSLPSRGSNVFVENQGAQNLVVDQLAPTWQEPDPALQASESPGWDDDDPHSRAMWVKCLTQEAGSCEKSDRKSIYHYMRIGFSTFSQRKHALPVLSKQTACGSVSARGGRGSIGKHGQIITSYEGFIRNTYRFYREAFIFFASSSICTGKHNPPIQCNSYSWGLTIPLQFPRDSWSKPELLVLWTVAARWRIPSPRYVTWLMEM